jgi:hypothetical protein
MVGVTVAVVLFGAPAVLSTGPAGADTIGGTRAQIDALEAAVQSGAARIHRLTLDFDQANLDAVSLAQQVGADQAAIVHLRGQVAASVSLLRQQAILSYTGGMSANLADTQGSTDPSVRAEYLQVAAGSITDTVDAYRFRQRQLATAEAGLAAQERASRAAANAAAAARSQALAEASAEQGRLAGLQSQLNQLEAAAALAAARQRQAAEAAAAHSAAQQAAAEQTAATPRVAATQGLPVNNGLVTVVRKSVSPSAPAPPPPTPLPPHSSYQDAGGVWLQLRECESSDNYAANTGNGYYGAYQFSEPTWTGLGYPGRPDLESHQMQDQAAMKLQAQGGWGEWPACAAALGLT